jgi:hypothetical protein
VADPAAVLRPAQAQPVPQHPQQRALAKRSLTSTSAPFTFTSNSVAGDSSTTAGECAPNDPTHNLACRLSSHRFVATPPLGAAESRPGAVIDAARPGRFGRCRAGRARFERAFGRRLVPVPRRRRQSLVVGHIHRLPSSPFPSVVTVSVSQAEDRGVVSNPLDPSNRPVSDRPSAIHSSPQNSRTF